MISVVLYGRNDNYGYNLHKRAALSFNCIAEVLEPSDEIIFVDYNTPDDFPTFPEAIFDTLTEKALTLLRILRVRPTIHDRFKAKTRLLALEPIARNIAVRRSLPSNRWILSTNTDLIFIPLRDRTLTDISRDLGPGFYHAPRIELPETLWESLDRRNPREVIDTVHQWGNTLHINEIVLGSEFIRYDGPGDFQLMQRSDLFDIHGFHENMLLGWHVDSNIARRLGLLHGKVGDLGHDVFGYHCDHTRQVTSAHSHTRTENDWRLFVDAVELPEIPEQADTWGCPDDDIEEIRLVPPRTQIYIRALEKAIGKPLEQPTYARYASESYNQVDYDPRHIMPFLADLFATSSKNANVVWYGLKHETLRLFGSVWRDLGFKEDIIIDSDHLFLEPGDLEGIGARLVPSEAAFLSASVFVFDFGAPLRIGADKDETSAYSNRIEQLLKVFMLVVRNERERMRSERPLRRVVAINAINNNVEQLVCQHLAISYSPFSGRMRHGFVLPPLVGKQDWLRALLPGPAGVRLGPEIVSANTKRDFLCFGPYRHLEPGHYRLTVRLSAPEEQRQLWKDEPCVILEVLSANCLLGVFAFSGSDMDDESRSLTFDVPTHIGDAINTVETRLRVLTEVEVALRALTIELVDLGDPATAQPVSVLQFNDWLPFLWPGPAGDKAREFVQVDAGRDGVVVYGPYWPLPVGRYELTVVVVPNFVILPRTILGKVDVFANPHILAECEIQMGEAWYAGIRGLPVTVRLPFEITTAIRDALIETRVVAARGPGFSIRHVSVVAQGSK